MEKQCILGIDGGQSSTLALLCDQAGTVLGIGRGGPSNHIHEPGGRSRLERALRDSIQGAFADADLPLETVSSACCGMTGGAEHVSESLSAVVGVERLQVECDFVTAHAGALAGAPGVVIISGTGSIAFGVNNVGERVRSGGWGYIMGDEGSGYDLGRQALVCAAQACDGRGPATGLLESIIEHFGKRTLWDVRCAIYGGEINRPAIAELSRLVIEAGASGDEVAREILQRAGEQLAKATACVLDRLGMLEKTETVSTVGGVFRAGDAILKPFAEHLRTIAPLAQIRPPIYPPAVGAVLLALRLAEVSIDAKVRQQLEFAIQTLEQEK